MTNAKPWVTAVILFIAALASAQDIHFSHMHRAPLQLNPALAGASNADIRMGAMYRSQWQSVPVPYTTAMAFADGRFGPQGLGVGIQLLTDKAGDGEMRWFQGAVSVSYAVDISEQFSLSAGLQGAFAQRSFEWGRLTFDEQYDGDQFNAGAATGEDVKANNLSFPSLGAGLNLRYAIPGTRTQFDFGAGVHQLLQPQASFFNDDTVRISRRFSPYLLCVVQVAPKLDIAARAWPMSQSPYAQFVTGAALIYHLQTARDREISLELGMLNRWNDALIPHVGLRYRTWEAGFSYDINLSDFQSATNQRGGPEFFLQHFIFRVQPPPVFKACPIF
jgi:type IX secretion system PorP/SprF family membrane protein